MKKLIVIGIGLIAAIAVLVWFVIKPESSSKNQTQPVIEFPTGSSATIAGNAMTANDFLSDPETKEDPANSGYYFLGNQPSASAAYIIQYESDTKYFTISLLQEPLSQSRTMAESYLLGHFGFSIDQLCSLDYTVTSPDSVNSTYSDTNLGFSFCPGAVQLPY